MRVVLQRVKSASVEVEGEITGKIGKGLLLFLGIEEEDAEEDLEWLVRKIIAMRIFSDEEGKMNKSVEDIAGEILLVSQFTLHASTRKGNRPSFIRAASPEYALEMYNKCLEQFRAMGLPPGSGIFGANMQVSLVNDGPVTIIIDSKLRE